MSSPALEAAKSLALSTETLDNRESQYVAARMMGNPPVVAARVAGYPDPIERSMDLEQDLRVKGAMEHANKLKSYERRLTRNDVLDGFMDAVRMASTATELVGAWREIGRVIGAYEPSKVNVTVTHQQQLKEMGDEELAQVAAIEGEYEVLDFDAE